jgi:SAM-dependent methyltransferase
MGPVHHSGYCHCCRAEATFSIEGPWLRDEYRCLTCGSIPRQRHLQYVLDTYFVGWEQARMHESSPSNGLLSAQSTDYSASQFFDRVPLGSSYRGVRCENLEQLTFADETFDLFITQDVFEHVFNPDRALRDIMRVLKPGGAHVFTAPKHRHVARSYPRARLVDGQVEYLMEQVYHGNPIGDGRSLVTWDYGHDVEHLMAQWCGYPPVTYVTRDRRLGIDGEYLEVFVIRKF